MATETATTRPPQDEAAVSEALRAAVERMAELAEARVEGKPEWTHEALLEQVRLGLDNLRRYIEDPTEESVSWDFPFVELTYPVEWDFAPSDTQPHGRRVSTFTPEDVVDGKVPEERVLEVLEEFLRLEALSRLTSGVVEWREAAKKDADGRYPYILSQALVDWLDEKTGTRATEAGVEGPPEGVKARRRLVDKLASPFAVGDMKAEAAVADAKRNAPNRAELEDLLKSEAPLSATELTAAEWGGYAGCILGVDALEDDAETVPPLTFTITTDAGETLEGAVVAMVYPLVVDADARRAWFTMGVGLVFTKGDPRHLSEKDLAELWKGPGELDAGETPRSETSERSTKAARSAPRAGPPAPRTARLLLEGRTRIDTKAAQLVGFVDGTTLPRKWDRIRRWEDLVQAEVGRIREAHGETAFEAVAGVREALLVRTFTATGEELVKLTKQAEADLLDREGHKGFRGVFTDRDKVPREYLVKRFRAGGGHLEIRLSWYGWAWPLVAEARDEEEKRLRELKLKSSGLLFEDLHAEDQRRVDAGLRLLGTMKDARDVMDFVLRRFGMMGENPLRIPARELRILLECETDEDGHSRVEGALRALQEIRFDMKAAGVGAGLSGHAFGALLDTVRYEGRGPGKHTDGDFYLSLSETAVGCLRAFRTADYRIRDARRVFLFDWSAKLEKDARRDLDFVQGFSALAPYYDRAKGFTPPQRLLRTWLEHNLTLRKDAAANGREAYRVHHSSADAGEPRVYGADFCPLLDTGRRYHAALGHYQKNAETGRKLRGRPHARTATGGAKTGGLLEALGYDLTPGRGDAGRTKVAEAALKDLRAVVEEALGGVVAGKHRGRWLTLKDAAKLRVEELLEVSWFLFLPEDWLARVRRDIEAHHEGRLERGETDRPVRVTTDRTTYEKALEDRGEAAEGVGLAELRQRLYAARKDRRLSQTDVGRVFGVSQSIVASWERGPERRGKAIPEDLRPLVLRWIEKGEGPTADELKVLAVRRRGGPRKAES